VINHRVRTNSPRKKVRRVRARREIEDDLFADQKLSSGAIVHVRKFAVSVTSPGIRVESSIRWRGLPRALHVLNGKR
jgi:hypothetical protein